MKLAFTTLGCPEWNIDTIALRAKEYGFQGVDFRMYLGDCDLWKFEEFSTRIAETKKKFDDAGLIVTGVCSSAGTLVANAEDRAKQLDILVRSAEVAAALRSGSNESFIRIFGGQFRERTEEDAIKESVDVLRVWTEKVKQFNVKLVLETHDDWTFSHRIAKALELVNKPNLAALWDMSHPYRFGKESPETTWNNIGKWIQYTHIKDAIAKDDQNKLVLTGKGNLPLAQMVNLLLDHGYNGWFTFEWEKKWHPTIEEPEIAFPGYIEFMRKLDRKK